MTLRIVPLRLLLTFALIDIRRTCAGADADVKPPIRGLISMGAYNFVRSGGQPVNTLAAVSAKSGIFSGIVLVPSWQQLQPVTNGPLRTEVIDNFLSEVRLYNAANPANPLAVKLRVWGGFVAPMWATSSTAPPAIRVMRTRARATSRSHARPFLVCRNTGKAWANLQATARREIRQRAADPGSFHDLLHVVHCRAVSW